MTEDNNKSSRMEVFYDTDSGSQQTLVVDPETPVKPVVRREAEPNKPIEPKNKVLSNDINVSENLDEEAGIDPEEEVTEDETKSDEERELEAIDNELTGGKKTPKTKEKKLPPSKAGSPSSSQSYSVLAKALVEEGVFSPFEEDFNELVEELGTPAAALVELGKRTVKAGVDDWKESLNPLQQEYLNALEAGVPHETISSLQSMEDHFSSIKPENVEANDDLAKDLYTQMLSVRGFTKEEIAESLSEADSVGNIKTKGKAALGFLQRHVASLKQQEVAAATAKQESVKNENANFATNLKKTLAGITEIAKGQKLSPKLKAQIFSDITIPLVRDANGQQYNLIGKKRLEDKLFDIKLAYFIRTGLFDGDMTQVNRSAMTNAVQELDGLLGAGSSVRRGHTKASPASEQVALGDSKEILKSLERFKKGIKNR